MEPTAAAAAAEGVGSISIAAASGYSSRTSEILSEIVRGEVSAAHDGVQGAALDAAVESMLLPGGGVKVHELAGMAEARRSPTIEMQAWSPSVDVARVSPTYGVQGRSPTYGVQGRSPAHDAQPHSDTQRAGPTGRGRTPTLDMADARALDAHEAAAPAADLDDGGPTARPRQSVFEGFSIPGLRGKMAARVTAPAKQTRADKNSVMLESGLMAQPDLKTQPGVDDGLLFALPEEEADEPPSSARAMEHGAADEVPPPPPPEARGGSRRQLFAEAAAPPAHAPAAAAATRRPDSWFPSWLSWGEPAAPTSGETASPARRHQRSGDEAARVLQARWRARRRARWQEVARRRRQRELVLFLAGQVRYLVITPLPG